MTPPYEQANADYERENAAAISERERYEESQFDEDHGEASQTANGPVGPAVKKKRGRPRKEKPSKVGKASSLKVVISRTYSEGAKINIGNYQSRDFFASATRMMEVAQPAELEYLEQLSAQLLQLVKEEVKAALKAETDDASGTKPMVGEAPKVEEAPSVPDAFTVDLKRNVPWNKYVPREDAGELDDSGLEQ